MNCSKENTNGNEKFLEQVMYLHERTADAAVYILLGQLHLVADLHKRVLGTLGSVLRSNSIERELAERQILEVEQTLFADDY